MNDLSNLDPKRQLLRHTLATLAYRGGKAVRNAPDGFSAFQAGQGVRSPGTILAHIGDLMDWGLSIPWERARGMAPHRCRGKRRLIVFSRR